MIEGLKIVTEEELRQTTYVWLHLQEREDEERIEAEGVTIDGEIHILDCQE